MSFDLAESHLKRITGGEITSLYENYLIEKGERSRNERGYSYFHPSAFGDCLRKIAYQFYGEKYPEKYALKDDVEPKFIRICDAGHAFHHRMQQDFGDMGILRGYWRCRACDKVHGRDSEPDPNRPVGVFMPDTCSCGLGGRRQKSRLFEYEEIRIKSEDEYNFQGNTDGIVETDKGNPNSRKIIDFKTSKSSLFDDLEKPDKKYIVQVQIYMWLTGVKKAIIYYENKDIHTLKEFTVDYDEKIIDWIKRTSSNLKLALEANKIPAKPDGYMKSKIPCKWCDFVKICYAKKA